MFFTGANRIIFLALDLKILGIPPHEKASPLEQEQGEWVKHQWVHGCLYLPVSIASASLTFHSSATSFAKGSSGFGALNSAWIDNNTVRICKAGLHLSKE